MIDIQKHPIDSRKILETITRRWQSQGLDVFAGMTAEELEAFTICLFNAAWIDGVLHPAEKAILELLLPSVPTQGNLRRRLRPLLKKAPSARKVMGAVDNVPDRFKEKIICYLYDMISVDNVIHPKEYEWFTDMAQMMQIGDDKLKQMVDAWTRKGEVDTIIQEKDFAAAFNSMILDLANLVQLYRDKIDAIETKCLEVVDVAQEYRTTCDKILESEDLADLMENLSSDFKAKFKAHRNQIEELVGEDFTVVFAGYYNVGKSSVANAILEKEEFFSTGPIPTTQNIHEQKWNSLFLVDTPGIDSMDAEDEKIAKNRIETADLVIFVTTAEGELDSIEIEFLRQIMDMKKKVLFVINKKDRVGASAEQKIVSGVKQQLKNFLGLSRVPVSIVSTRMLFDGLNTYDTEKIRSSGIPELQNRLLETLREEGIGLRSANLLQCIKVIVADCLKTISYVEDVLKKKPEAKNIPRSDIEALFTGVRNQVRGLITDIEAHFAKRVSIAEAMDKKYCEGTVKSFLKGVFIIPEIVDLLTMNKKNEKIQNEFVDEAVDFEVLWEMAGDRIYAIEEDIVDWINEKLPLHGYDDLVQPLVDALDPESIMTSTEEKAFGDCAGDKDNFKKWQQIYRNSHKRFFKKISTEYIERVERAVWDVVNSLDAAGDGAKRSLDRIKAWLEAQITEPEA